MKVVLYVRESPSLAENEDTIESQIQAIEERIKADGHELIDKYKDNGWAGDLLVRPELDRLRDDASLKKYEAVYMFDRSRLARKYWLQELVLEELQDKNIEVVFLKEPKAVSDEDKVVQGIKGLFAEYERAKITERTRRGRLFRAKQGLLVGHEAPYGYKYVRPDGDRNRWYEIVEDEATVVRMIFNWLAYDHFSTHKIIQELYILGIKPRNGKDYWATSTIARLIKREDYIGKGFYNKSLSTIPTKPLKTEGYKRHKKTSRKAKPKQDWLEFSVPQIIDEELFRLAQVQIKKNQELSPRNIKRDYLLRGLLQCDECNSKYAGEAYRSHRYYRSTLRIRKFPLKQKCICTTINADQIEEIIWSSLKELLCNPKLIQSQYDRYTKLKNTTQLSNQVELDKLYIQLNDLERAEKRLIEAYSNGTLTLEQISERMEQIKAQKKSLEFNISKVSVNKVPLSPLSKLDINEITNKFKEIFKNLPSQNRAMIIHALIERIKIRNRQLLILGTIPNRISLENGIAYQPSLLSGCQTKLLKKQENV